MVNEMAQAFVIIRLACARLAFKKSNAPAVGMMVGVAAALREAAKAEGHVSGRVAVHAEELAHD